MSTTDLVAAYHAFEAQRNADTLGQGRVAVELRERLPGGTYADVAAALGRPRATVHRRAQRYLAVVENHDGENV